MRSSNTSYTRRSASLMRRDQTFPPSCFRSSRDSCYTMTCPADELASLRETAYLLRSPINAEDSREAVVIQRRGHEDMALMQAPP